VLGTLAAGLGSGGPSSIAIGSSCTTGSPAPALVDAPHAKA
jgi:hypothetical protein